MTIEDHAALSADELPPLLPSDLMVFADGGRSAFQATILSCMRGIPKEHKVLNLFYKEEAIQARRSSIANPEAGTASTSRGFMTIRQLEQLMLVTCPASNHPLVLHKRPNKHFDGSTTGDSLFPVGLPVLSDPKTTWRATVAEKRKMMADALVAGEKSEKGGDDDRSDTSQEPFNFYERIPELYSEILHRTAALAVVDLSGSDTVLAKECIELRIPYFGILHSSHHVISLMSA